MAQILEEKKVETKAWPWLTFGLACAVASAACVWIPIHIIRPFHPQNAAALALALAGGRAGIAAVRVHDVRETVQALEVDAALRGDGHG